MHGRKVKLPVPKEGEDVIWFYQKYRRTLLLSMLNLSTYTSEYSRLDRLLKKTNDVLYEHTKNPIYINK